MKSEKTILIIILSLCATSISAKTISYADKHAATQIFMNAMSDINPCLDDSDFKACSRISSTQQQLFLICHTYDYQEACQDAEAISHFMSAHQWSKY